MRETDQIRRFHLQEVGQFGDAKRGWEIVDRAGFMGATFFSAGGNETPEKARERAAEVAKARNECEVNGHDLDDSGCKRCDAAFAPETIRRRS